MNQIRFEKLLDITFIFFFSINWLKSFKYIANDGGEANTSGSCCFPHWIASYLSGLDKSTL